MVFKCGPPRASRDSTIRFQQMSIRSTSSNDTSGSARDHQHCQHLAVTALQRGCFASLHQPATVECLLVSQPANAKNYVRHSVDSQPPSSRRENYQPGCHEEERRVCRLASRYDGGFDRHPTGTPDSWLRACYEEDAMSSPPLLAQARPLQRSFCQCASGTLSFPDCL
jgi:hypothetical protein